MVSPLIWNSSFISTFANFILVDPPGIEIATAFYILEKFLKFIQCSSYIFIKKSCLLHYWWNHQLMFVEVLIFRHSKGSCLCNISYHYFIGRFTNGLTEIQNCTRTNSQLIFGWITRVLYEWYIYCWSNNRIPNIILLVDPQNFIREIFNE